MKKKIIIITFMTFWFHQVFSFTITQPGFFSLGSDVVESGDVLTIAVGDLTVDLGRHVVSGGTTGIVVNAGLSNISIINGRIDNNTKGITIGSGCSDITLQGLDITNCPLAALEVMGTVGDPVTRLVVDNVKAELTATASVAESVMSFTYVEDLILSNIKIARNGASDVELTAVNLLDCSRGSFNDVLIICNQGATFQGFRLENTSDVIFNNCKARVNTATADLVGFRFTGGSATSGNFCQDCIVTNNSSTNGPFVGFDLLPFVTRNVLHRCIASNNSTSAAVSTANCIGFNFDQPTFCCVLDCRATLNRATGDGVSNYCMGFNIGTSSVTLGTGTKDSEFSGNQAFYNIGPVAARSFGICVMSNNSSTGNSNNVYSLNAAGKNGPIDANQITSTSGINSDGGGIPNNSVQQRQAGNLNFDIGYGNLRIGN